MKEFLLSDELQLGCKARVPSSIGAEVEAPRSNVYVEASLQQRLGCVLVRPLRLWGHWGGTDSSFFPRTTRSKDDEIFIEKTLLDLEAQYGSTEQGRRPFECLLFKT